MPVSAACTATVPATTPDSRFSNNDDGTVTDIRTGLVWKRCSEGQAWDGTTCAGTASTYTWQTALQAGAASAYAGKSDWRLPNIKELDSIVERQCYSPAINSTIFPNTPASVFWSGSPYAGSYYAWLVHFYYGYDSYDYRSDSFYVRLVRGGQ
jgi:hypothetical protein